jgi:hypothetical protein
MAAHALTIIKQVLEKPDFDICNYALSSLPAPGWDSFPWGNVNFDWYDLIQEKAKQNNILELRQVLEQAKTICEPSNSHFRCLEDFREGFSSFVKFKNLIGVNV